MVTKILVLLCLACAVSAQRCISFTAGPDTNCEWMCKYCANAFDTSDYYYYFTSPSCTCNTSGYIGNPVIGVEYTCCYS